MDIRTPDQYPQRNQLTATPANTPVAPAQPTPLQTTAPSRKRRLLWAALAVLAVFVLGGGVYLLTSHRQTAAPDTKTTTTRAAQNQTPVAPPPSAPSDSSLKQYTSNGKDLNLNFSYPSSWSVTPPTNSNPDDHAITVTSPTVSLNSASGTSSTGKIVVSIRPGGSAVSELAGDKATAAQASTQIAYDKPTSVQHQYPYLTFIHLSGGSNPSSVFEEVMITGIVAFAKDQAILQVSAGQFAPIISARFYTCSSTTCDASSAAALSITNSIWNNDSTCKQSLAILQSLQIN